MAYRRTRRKRRQLWLPLLGTQGTIVEGQLQPGSASYGVEGTLTGAETISYDAFPLTYDQGADPYASYGLAGSFNPFSLRDLVSGNEWFLRRVVGKFFCGIRTAAGDITLEDRAPAVECGFGLIVCNTDDDGTPTTNFTEVNPLVQESAEDPWIWQRQWLLSPNAFYQNSGAAFNLAATSQLDEYQATAFMPMHNTQCGSVMDGPHVDAKTARRIHRTERLFGVFAMRTTRLTDAGGQTTADVTMYYRARLRLLGNIRSSAGNRGNASR